MGDKETIFADEILKYGQSYHDDVIFSLIILEHVHRSVTWQLFI
jgi:hypothetical protein